jgi:tRNA(fMet)-specific endonuclease VapC
VTWQLDTDTCIYLLEGRAPAAVERLRAVNSREVTTSAITAAELYFGALHSQRPGANVARVELSLRPFTVASFNTQAARKFAEIKQQLSSTGQLIGPMDLLIAATAIAQNNTLVTNNTREFSRVPGLRSENWIHPE